MPKPLSQFIADSGIVARNVHRVSSNPQMAESSQMDNWKLTLSRVDCGRSVSMTVFFSMGLGHNGAAPQLSNVLDCLASDAAGVENTRSFEDWAGDYGYDPDSRKAEATYRAVSRLSARLKAFLGDDLYSELLWDVERE